MIAHANFEQIKRAADAAIIINQQLVKLLDAYDFFIERHIADTPSTALEIRDLAVSIMALGTLPLQLANRLDDWTREVSPELSTEGFEIYVINELAIHMYSVASFFWRKYIDTGVDHPTAREAFCTLREMNRAIKS